MVSTVCFDSCLSLLFQATRNTGKSIAERNIANPTAMLLASCMMLDHLKWVFTSSLLSWQEMLRLIYNSNENDPFLSAAFTTMRVWSETPSSPPWTKPGWVDDASSVDLIGFSRILISFGCFLLVAHAWHWGSGHHVRGGPVYHEGHPEQRAAHSRSLSSIHSSEMCVCVSKRRCPFIFGYRWHHNG